MVPNISRTNGLAFKEHIRYGYRCIVPYFPIREKARKARDNLYAWITCNLWTSLPKCVRNITGEKVDFFKKILDKALAFYPDVPRCSGSGICTTEMGANLTHYLTTIEIEILGMI